MDRNKELLKNSLVLSIGILVPKVLSLLILPILTTYLTTVEYGNYDLVNTIVSFVVPVITLQIQQAAFRHLIAEKMVKNAQKTIVSTAIAFVLFVSLIASPIVFLIFHLYKFDLSVNLVICLLVLGESLYLLTGQIMRGIGKNVAYSLGIVTYSIVNFVTVYVYIFILRMGLFGVILSITTSYLLSALVMLVNTAIACGFSFRYVSLSELKKMLAFSAPIVPSSISLWIVNLSDRLLIVHYLGAAVNGIYAVATKVPTLFATVYSIFNLAWTETAAKTADEEKNPGEYYSSMFSLLYTFLSGALLVIIAFIPLFYDILINVQYQEAYKQTIILSFGVYFNSFVAFYASIYIAMRQTKQVGISSAIGAILNLLINFLLIRHIGLYAASISTALSYFIIMIYRAISINGIVKLTYKWKEIFIGLLLNILSSILIYTNSIWAIVFCMIIAVAYNFVYNRKYIAALLQLLRKKEGKT